MTDSWFGRDFGYDQVGITDPYYDIYRTRFGFNPDEIVNINAPTQHYDHKRPYEKESVDDRCQELLINLRNNEDEKNRYKARIKILERENAKRIDQTEPFYSPAKLFGNLDFTIILIFIFVIFIALQLQIQETNRLLYAAILSQKST